MIATGLTLIVMAFLLQWLDRRVEADLFPGSCVCMLVGDALLIVGAVAKALAAVA